jgi:hypothetical protein
VRKRSALTVAGGLVGALLSGVVGYTMRLTGGEAPSTTARAAEKPIVKTITSTIRIKKKPKVRHVAGPTGASAAVSSSSGSSKPPATSTGGSHPSQGGDDGGEREGGDD